MTNTDWAKAVELAAAQRKEVEIETRKLRQELRSRPLTYRPFAVLAELQPDLKLKEQEYAPSKR